MKTQHQCFDSSHNFLFNIYKDKEKNYKYKNEVVQSAQVEVNIENLGRGRARNDWEICNIHTNIWTSRTPPFLLGILKRLVLSLAFYNNQVFLFFS